MGAKCKDVREPWSNIWAAIINAGALVVLGALGYWAVTKHDQSLEDTRLEAELVTSYLGVPENSVVQREAFLEFMRDRLDNGADNAQPLGRFVSSQLKAVAPLAAAAHAEAAKLEEQKAEHHEQAKSAESSRRKATEKRKAVLEKVEAKQAALQRLEEQKAPVIEIEKVRAELTTLKAEKRDAELEAEAALSLEAAAKKNELFLQQQINAIYDPTKATALPAIDGKGFDLEWRRDGGNLQKAPAPAP